MAIEQIAYARRLAKNGGARAIRQGAGLSLRDIARELDVYPMTVLRWERGERVPRAEAAERYARLLKRLSR